MGNEELASLDTETLRQRAAQSNKDSLSSNLNLDVMTEQPKVLRGLQLGGVHRLKTIEVTNENGKRLIINKGDYNPAVHTLVKADDAVKKSDKKEKSGRKRVEE